MIKRLTSVFLAPSDAKLIFRGAFSFGNSIIMKHPDNNE